MKIAIQGHPTRGKEVIQILESLGGKNTALFKGNQAFWYFINSHNNIVNDYEFVLTRAGFKIYTLEEFEKEFPFKVGDKVRHISSTCIIKEYGFMNNKPVYVVKSTELGILATIPVELLKSYKEMEERNITLTLDKAKEWYNKGGELREIALQAFTKMELNSLPRSWKDYCKNYSIKPEEVFIDGYSKFIVNNVGDRNPVHDKNICPSVKSAEAHLAMIQLEQLRNCWWNDWEPTWDISEKWCIRLWGNELSIGIATNISRFLTFPTKEMAEEFLKCFRDLIELAKDLI